MQTVIDLFFAGVIVFITIFSVHLIKIRMPANLPGIDAVYTRRPLLLNLFKTLLCIPVFFPDCASRWHDDKGIVEHVIQIAFLKSY